MLLVLITALSEKVRDSMRYGSVKYGPLVADKQRSADRWGWLVFVLVLSAIVLATPACGSSDDQSSGEEQEAANAEPTPVEAVQVAYRKTASEQTAKVDFTTTVSGMPDGTSIDMSGQGVVDFENQNAAMNMLTPMGEIEMRQLGTVVYQRWPEAMQAQLPGQRPWIVMDLDKMMHEQFGATFSEIQGNAPTDPSQQLAHLQGVSDSVEELGEEEVRGEPTTHYHATVDLEKAAAEQGGQTQQLYDQLEQQLGTTSLPMDVWLDGHNRVRRMEMSMPPPTPPNQSSQQAANSSGEPQMRMVYEYYDFGTPVNVQAPPSDQTTDIAELMAAAKQQKAAQQDAPEQKAPAPR
jgi:hypothetical protein